ncbi:hypothetical protein T02_1032 [Trichinella nativa]|uniref:Uncharacterized protein n=1 Tax=Trichinella nativa TaxID=6335 RepID=A0A0V1KY40_9BILA|nr:hypothetical protein T02_1032 [Trichinella nativa]
MNTQSCSYQSHQISNIKARKQSVVEQSDNLKFSSQYRKCVLCQSEASTFLAVIILTRANFHVEPLCPYF